MKTEALVAEMMERLACGEPMAQICRDEHMPSFGTVWRWGEEDPSFKEHSARAREYGTHYIADDCMKIADDPSLEPADKRVRIDTRLRLIGKWNSKRYGDRLELAGDEDAPLKTITRIERHVVDPKD